LCWESWGHHLVDPVFHERVASIADPEVNHCAIELMRQEFALHLEERAEIEDAGAQLRVSAGAQSVQVDRVLCSIGSGADGRGTGARSLGLR